MRPIFLLFSPRRGLRMWGALPPMWGETPHTPLLFCPPTHPFCCGLVRRGAEGRTAFAGGSHPLFFGIPRHPLHEGRDALATGDAGRMGRFASPKICPCGKQPPTRPFCCGPWQWGCRRTHRFRRRQLPALFRNHLAASARRTHRLRGWQGGAGGKASPQWREPGWAGTFWLRSLAAAYRRTRRSRGGAMR